MGNHNGKLTNESGANDHEILKTHKNNNDSGNTGNVTHKNSQSSIENKEDCMTRSASGADINEKTFTQLVPIEKLSKV